MTSAEFSQALEGMDATELALGAGMVGVIGTLLVVGGIIWFFISALGYFKMFKKAGVPAWMAFIPLVGDYARFKMSWNMKIFVPYIISLVLVQTLPSEGSLAMSLVTLVVSIIFLVLHVKLCIRMAKSFGKGTGWGWLMVVAPFIVSLILGFGSAEYQGNPDNN